MNPTDTLPSPRQQFLHEIALVIDEVATGDGDATTERPGAERLGIVAARRILDLIQDFGFAIVQAEPQRSVALDGALVAAERFRGQGLPEILQREEMVTEAIRAYISDGDVMAVAA